MVDPFANTRLRSNVGLGRNSNRGASRVNENSGVNGSDVPDISFGILGLLPQMLCAKAQQPYQ